MAKVYMLPIMLFLNKAIIRTYNMRDGDTEIQTVLSNGKNRILSTSTNSF